MIASRCARTIAIAAVALGSLRCGTSSTSPSSTPAPAPASKPNVSVTGIQVSAAATGAAGYRYQTVVHLHESSGVAATITGVDVTFLRNGVPIVSSHFDKPISDGTNVCPASGAIDTRELDTTDADASHAPATSVKAVITFSDGASFTSTATGSADVPAIAPLPPQTYTITGVITDVATHATLAGARVEALNGTNAGKAATTDGTGVYTLGGLVPETFRMRASASGYDSGEQNVTIPTNPRADFELRASAGATACAYTVTSNVPATVAFDGGQFSVIITRTSGNCGWQASADAGWITFPNGASGGDSGALVVAVAANGLNTRSGTIVVTWTGGSARVAVTQGPHPDFECFVSISKGPEDFDNVPSAGGTLTVFASVYAVPSGWPCTGSVAGSVSWISGGGTITGPSTLTFTVAANPTPGTARTGSIVAQVAAKTAAVGVTER